MLRCLGNAAHNSAEDKKKDAGCEAGVGCVSELALAHLDPSPRDWVAMMEVVVARQHASNGIAVWGAVSRRAGNRDKIGREIAYDEIVSLTKCQQLHA